MITINNVAFSWCEGMTLENARDTALEYRDFCDLNDYKLMNMHNGLFIEESCLCDTPVTKGDVILFMPVVSGG